MKELRKGEWFPVDNLLIDVAGRQFGYTPLAVYICLKRHANQQNLAWPTYQLMAEELNMCPRTVSRSIEYLVAFGLITRTKKRRTGKWANYVYFLVDRDNWDIEREPCDISSDGDEEEQDEMTDHVTTMSSPSDNDDSDHKTESPIKKTNNINKKEEDTIFSQKVELSTEQRRQKFEEAKKAFYSKLGNRNLS